MPWRLEDIEIDELSLVEAGANKKKFLFRKADEIKGTLKSGCLVCPECDHQEAITDFLKNAGEECSECGTNLIESDAKLFFKGDKTMGELIEIIEEFIGEDEIEESVLEKIKKIAKKLPADAVKALKGSLNILNKYKNLMPDDVKKAIDVLAKAAAGAYGTAAKEDDDGDVKKAGAKISKTTLDLIKKVIETAKNHSKSVQGLEMLLRSSLKKGEGVEELEEKMEEILKKLDKIEKGEDLEDEDEDEDKDKDDDKDEDEDDEDEDKGKKKPISKKTLKKFDEIAKRLDKVEKQKGVKKSLTGDEDEDDEDVDDEDITDLEKGKKKKHEWGFTFARKDGK